VEFYLANIFAWGRIVDYCLPFSVSVYLWRAIDSLRAGNKFSAEDWDVYGEVSILGR
jgi:hypothetical protein